jgi:sRNA-binding carbon storage regulator CsrA
MTIHREEIHQRIQLERMGGGKAGSVTADVPALIVQCVGSQ